MHPRDRIRLLLVLSVVLTTASAPGPEDSNWQRLQSAPPEQRERWARGLSAFDALATSEQQAIRDLDARIQELSPEDRAHYHTVARRYHLWLRSLPEARRIELAGLAADQRMTAVARIVKERSDPPATTPIFARLVDFAGLSPFEMATLAKAWVALAPAQQSEVERLPEAARPQRIRELAATLDIAPIETPPNWGNEADFDRLALRPALAALKRGGDVLEKLPKAKRRIVESMYFVDHAPARVRPELLAQFIGDLPPWVRSQFDSLAPDEARRRATILYRLVYPPPAEHTTKKAAPAPPPSAPSAPARPTGPTAPF